MASKARRLLLRAGLLTAGLVLSFGVLAGAEARFRQEENSNGLRFTPEQPARKFALLPNPPMINARGFHERELPDEAPPGVITVVVLGDSMTFGGGLKQTEVYPRVAEELLRSRGLSVRVVNLSVFGYDAEQAAATLADVGWRYKPDLVVYAAYTNDGDPTRLIQVGPERKPVYVGTEPPTEAGALGPALQRHSAMFRRYRGAREARRIQENRGRGVDFGEAFFAEHLAAMVADAKLHQVPLAVWVMAPQVMAEPELSRCGGKAGRLFCQDQARDIGRIERLALGHGLRTGGALEALKRGPERSYPLPVNPDDLHHPNAQGNEVIGQAFADFLAGALGDR